MGKTDLKERFIELRATGLSYSDIARELGVSKPTLIAWGKELQKEVANARTLRMDELFEKFAVSKEKRVGVYGARLEAILKELDRRDLKDVPTTTLFRLVMEFGDLLKNEEFPLTMQGDDRLEFPELTTTETWPI